MQIFALLVTFGFLLYLSYQMRWTQSRWANLTDTPLRPLVCQVSNSGLKSLYLYGFVCVSLCWWLYGEHQLILTWGVSASNVCRFVFVACRPASQVNEHWRIYVCRRWCHMPSFRLAALQAPSSLLLGLLAVIFISWTYEILVVSIGI